jgi:thiol:disulfide interchange protein/DsbC/DsbD-like thiol-disulfide interchange protein
MRELNITASFGLRRSRAACRPPLPMVLFPMVLFRSFAAHASASASKALRAVLAFGLAGLVMGAAHAQFSRAPGVEAGTDEVRARLLVPVTGVQPGQTLEIGLRQRIKEHWHTYWANPGDSGLATTIAWTAPAGTTARPIEWPAPKRFDIGPITNHGYEGEVTLLTSLVLPADLKVGDTLRLKADVRWLVCSDVCIPQDVQMAVALPVVAGPPAASAEASLIEAARRTLPEPLSAPARWTLDDRTLTLRFEARDVLPPHDKAHFFAGVFGQVVHAATQTASRDGPAGWQLQIAAGDTPPATGSPAVGVLMLERAGQPARLLAVGGGTPPLVPTVTAPNATPPGAAPGAVPAPDPIAAPFSLTEWLVAMGLALLGGLVLNLMPCVFPVLSIKALSLVRTAGAARQEIRLHGLAYTAGVLVCFAALAGLLLALKAAGGAVGWGFQFQSPVFVLLMALLMLAVGLSLSGVWTLGGSVAGVGSSLAEREGPSGSFFTGVLAAVVATPCTAPFMGAAIGYALTQPAAVTMAVFLALGLGLALPYLLLCEWPALQRALPRPGPWMDTLKQALAFPMYASAAWLAWVLTQQRGADGLAILLAGAVLLGFAAWLWGRTQTSGSPRPVLAGSMAAVLAALAVVGSAWTVRSPVDGADPVAAQGTAGRPVASPDAGAVAAASTRGWEPYSPERLQQLRAEGRPVFVNLTAAWCITCLVNERVALDTSRVIEAFARADITRLKGDWTQGDARITRLLAEHGRSGVPLYLMYPAKGGAPVLLPQLLTPDTVIDAIAAARPDRSP